MTGQIGILNVGLGDTKLVFDKSNPAETIRAGRVVKDMLRRGYALLIQTGTDADGRPVYQRAKDFDENTAEYIIADFDPVAAQQVDAADLKSAQESANAQTIEERTQAGRDQSEEGAEQEASAGEPDRPRRNRSGTKRIAASSARGVAVARSAGG